MKLIHINESAFHRLLSEDKRVPPFQDFYEDISDFVKGILRDPIGYKPNDRLSSYGIQGKDLRKKLYDYGIITKEERIDEPYDERSGKQQSRYYVKYSWGNGILKAMKNPTRMDNPLKERVRKLYQDYFKINEEITRDEINMMLNSPLTIGVISDESAPTYIKQATNIYNKKINKNKKEKL